MYTDIEELDTKLRTQYSSTVLSIMWIPSFDRILLICFVMYYVVEMLIKYSSFKNVIYSSKLGSTLVGSK